MSLFKDIVVAYNGYSLDADGLKEIELLRYLSFENPLESVDTRKKLVVVIVESRLLDNLTGSFYTTNDLLQRLITFKSDLLREGRQALFLEMKPYNGPIHQDGKTLLAIREFFKSIRSDFSNFEGAILVGSFPEASLVRTWPQYYQENGKDQYRVGLTPGQPRRFEIVLADIDGDWRNLYHSRTNADEYIFYITPSTTVSKNGSKVTLINPTIDKTTAALEDVFWIQDAVYRIISPNKVELDMTCKNPEINAQDRGALNPIAKPDICVSRINARSIAVQPPNPRLLDASGKPQQTPHKPSISFGMEDWRRDEKLERTLLVEYFDRNHAYRSGMYSDRGFSISLVEYDLGTYAAYEGLDGLGSPKDEVLNANLLNFTRWLKKPAMLRVISAHADCHSTFLGQQDDTSSMQTESEAGGCPWRWIEENGKYIPSFKGHYTGDLYLYRTLWENKKLTGIPPSLLVHVGCDVNSVDHPEQTYTHPWYGSFQNAECLLFYGNQLAVLCHTTHWNRGPRGFGKGFGASVASVFGDGWKEVSEWHSQDSQLIQQSTERKQNYIWSVVGDWTLQKYYGKSVIILPRRPSRHSSGFFKQSNLGQRGDFELVLPSKNGGFDHFVRKNDETKMTWCGPHNVDIGHVDAITMIQSTFGTRGNLEVIVRSGSSLKFFWRNDSQPYRWKPLDRTPKGWQKFKAIANPAMIQGNLGKITGNFELVVPAEGGGLVHFSRDNSIEGCPWNDGPNYFGDPGTTYSGVALIQSNFGQRGHLEVVAVTSSGKLVLYWRDDSPPYQWHGPEFFGGPGFTGTPCLLQGNLGGKPGNFELVVPVASGGLAHYSRSNNIFGLPWFGPEYFGRRKVSAVSMIQSNYGSHGNLEILAIEDDTIVHYLRDDFHPYRWYGPFEIEIKTKPLD